MNSLPVSKVRIEEDAPQHLALTSRSALGRPRPADPSASDLYRLGDRQSILEFDAKVANRAVHLGVAEQELDCP